MVLNVFSRYGPLILAKGISKSICRRDEIEEWFTGTSWHLWKRPHDLLLEPSHRNDKDRESR